MRIGILCIIVGSFFLIGCRPPELSRQTPTTVTHVYPRPGAKKVSSLAILKVTFSKPFALHKNALRVYLLGDQRQYVVPGFIYPERDMMTYVFVPTYPYKKGEKYCAVLLEYPPLDFSGKDTLIWDFQIEQKSVWEWFSSLLGNEEPEGSRLRLENGQPFLSGPQASQPKQYRPY